MFLIPFRAQGFIDTGTKIYNAENTDTLFQKTCACNYKNTYKISYDTPYKTTKGAYANLSQKLKYSAFVRRTQENTISKSDTIQFQFRNL
jgi:hypothetical protein